MERKVCREGGVWRGGTVVIVLVEGGYVEREGCAGGGRRGIMVKGVLVGGDVWKGSIMVRGVLVEGGVCKSESKCSI